MGNKGKRTEKLKPPADAVLAEFVCDVCKERAATVALVPPAAAFPMGPPLGDDVSDRWGLWVDAPHFHTRWEALAENDVAEIRSALTERDSRSLFRLADSSMSFYCPKCDAWYCHDHWKLTDKFDEGFYDCTYGVCPAGHKRMVDD